MNRHLLLYIIIALFSISILPLPVDGDMDIPPFAKEVLEKKGITIADLQKDSDLRRKWLKKFRVMGGKKGNDKTLGKHSRSERAGVNMNPPPQFYKVIIDNNLFRPLGYRRAKPGPPFELIATIVNHNSGGSKALIRSNADRRVHYVGVGEEFAGAKVEMIEPLKVKVLHRGKSQEFRASTGEFLGGGGDDRKPSHRMRKSESNPELDHNDSNSGPRDFNFEFEDEDMERKLKDLPPEARRKVMRQMMRKRREASEGKHRKYRGDESEEKNNRDNERDDEKRGK